MYSGFLFTAECNIVEPLMIMWVWTEEKQLNPNELKNKLLLSRDSAAYTPRGTKQEKSRLKSLEILASWAKKRN